MSYSLIVPHYHLPRLKMKELGRVYWCNTVATIGTSLVVIFVPIFLLKNGLSFDGVLEFLLLQQVLAALLQYPASRLFNHFHAHHILAAGTVLYGLFFGLLGTFQAHHWPIGLLALAWALNRSIYWAAFHYVFSSTRAHKVATRQIAGFEALAILASTAAPAIGGIIASLLGINYGYWAAVVLVLAAAAPLLTITGEPGRAHIYLTWHEFIAMRRDALANACNGIMLMAELNLWPLLVYALVNSYASVGILSSVIAISSVLVTLYVGRRQDKSGQRRYIQQGMAAYSLTNIGRAVVQTSLQVFGLNLLGGIGRSLYVTPYMNRYYTNSDGPHRLGYITVMETAYGIGAASFLVVLLILSLLFSMKDVLSIGLILVAVCSFGVRLMR